MPLFQQPIGYLAATALACARDRCRFIEIKGALEGDHGAVVSCAFVDLFEFLPCKVDGCVSLLLVVSVLGDSLLFGLRWPGASAQSKACPQVDQAPSQLQHDFPEWPSQGRADSSMTASKLGISHHFLADIIFEMASASSSGSAFAIWYFHSASGTAGDEQKWPED